MRLIENTDFTVFKFSMQQRQSHAAVSNIRNRSYDVAVYRKMRPQFLEDLERVAQMFEEIACHNDLKLLLSKDFLNRKPLNVADHQSEAVGLQVVGHCAIPFDGGDPTTPFLQHTRNPPCSWP